MKKALLSLLVFVVAFGVTSAHQVFSASSDDFSGNYVRRDSEDYNFLPLVLDPGLSTGRTGTLRDTISANMVQDQGYEVQCAKPEWSISPQVYGNLKEFFEQGRSTTLSNTATYTVDFSEGRIPLFRGDEATENTTKISSFEGYFGANNTSSPPADPVKNTGVSNLLLTQEGQCAVKYYNLKSVFEDGAICSKLENPNQCSLNKEISGTAYTYESLYRELDSLLKRTSNTTGRQLNCADISSPWNPDLEIEFNITEQQFERDILPVSEAVKQMPMNLDVLSRLAFLIIAPTQNPASGGDDIFSFLQTTAPQPIQGGGFTVNEERQAPIVVGFKVPALATNSIFSLPNLRDSALISAYAIRDIEALEMNEASVAAQREAFVQSIQENKNTKPVINCDGLAQCGEGSEEQALFQALIDIVNGSEISCQSFRGPYENAGDLYSPAAVSEDKNFRPPHFSTLLPSTNSAGFRWALQVNDANVQTQLSREKTPVNAYLITPYGTNLNYVADTLQSLFGQEQFATMVEENCIEDFHGECGLMPEYFTFGGVLDDFQSQSDSFSFPGEELPEGCDSPEILRRNLDCDVNNNLSIGANLTKQVTAEPFRILGAKLGWLIQKAQETFRETNSRALAYLQECKRTEDLFLGRCLGYQGKPGEQEGTVAGSCQDYSQIEVQMPESYMELGSIVCSVAQNNPKDVQLLWGLAQVDGRAIHQAIKAGTKTVNCSEVIQGVCGSSQLGSGLIVPQCVDRQACGQVDWAFEGNSGEQYQKEITTEVACSVRGQMEWTLQKRKSEMTMLREWYREAHGTDPSTDQLYFMMAGRNLGVPREYLVQPKCGDYHAVDPEGVGPCGGINYCQCVMERLTYKCGQRV